MSNETVIYINGKLVLGFIVGSAFGAWLWSKLYLKGEKDV